MSKGVYPGIISWTFQRFFVISQILSSMLVINMYPIIDYKVFGLTIGDSFLFSIVV
jgi:hypothetical protein